MPSATDLAARSPRVQEAQAHPKRTESILDRVVNTAHHVAMVGKSYRPNKRPGATRTVKQ